MKKSRQIFISYSKKDKEEVVNLYNFLKDKGFTPWFDEFELLPGQDWKLEISKALKKSHVILVCLSQKAVDKAGYLQKEIREALDIAEQQPEGSIFIIPVKLEECTLPMRLDQWHWVEVYKSDKMQKLVNALNLKESQISKYQNTIIRRETGNKGSLIPPEGKFRVEGKNNDGTLYKGNATIQRDGDVFILTWHFGQNSFVSKGAMKGDVLNVFGHWSVSYILNEDGSLYGIWGESGIEKLVPAT